MRLNSLALRLFFSATTWTVVILVVTGIVLSSLYRAAVERAFDRRLDVYLRALVADVATPEAFKQALLAAKSIVYGDPTLPNQSGEKAEQILASAGLLDALKGKLRIVPGQAESQDLIAKGEVELGLYNLSEIPEGKGLKIAGPVPAPLQLSTTYEGALMSDGSVPQAAREFIRFLSDPDARAKWLAAKLEPLADH